MKRYAVAFLAILLITSLVVAACGYALRTFVLEPIGLQREEHVMALPFVLMADELFQFQVRRGLEKLSEAPVETMPTEPDMTEPVHSFEPDWTERETQIPETEPVYVPVDESWFDDVLFIGDSRSFGLKTMGRLGNADYFCAGSMTVFSAVQVWLSDRNFYNTNLTNLLQQKTYGKIYIHLGLNELVGGVDAVMEGYLSLIDLIRKYQPDAVIVIQACMTMSESMGKRDAFSIDKFRELNRRLEELARSDPEGFRFCDTNTWAAGEDGYIRPEIACDDCHLYGMYYTEWGQFILEDAGWYGIP